MADPMSKKKPKKPKLKESVANPPRSTAAAQPAKSSKK
jgi:hypothetical protein